MEKYEREDNAANENERILPDGQERAITNVKDFAQAVKSILEQGYGIHNIMVLDILKNNGVKLTGINIRQEYSNIAPNIYLDDFYILPSSIHETIFVPAVLDEDGNTLIDMVREINETMVESEESCQIMCICIMSIATMWKCWDRHVNTWTGYGSGIYLP